MIKLERLPPEARTLLQRLRERHAPADLDVFLLPVNADGIHWFLLSADVREGQCVVRVHEPYGTDAAESRFEAG